MTESEKTLAIAAATMLRVTGHLNSQESGDIIREVIHTTAENYAGWPNPSEAFILKAKRDWSIEERIRHVER